MDFIINKASAATTGVQSENAYSLILFAVIFALFYFVIIRPQNKRAREQREMISKLRKDDEVVTSGGILAKVVSLDEHYIKVAPTENIEFVLQRNAITSILPKGTLKSI